MVEAHLVIQPVVLVLDDEEDRIPPREVLSIAKRKAPASPAKDAEDVQPVPKKLKRKIVANRLKRPRSKEQAAKLVKKIRRKLVLLSNESSDDSLTLSPPLNTSPKTNPNRFTLTYPHSTPDIWLHTFSTKLT
ncbi:hypothetical protein RJT34_09262 [Clitoria ternatea]|uniref:Uncharacterized protein n=1 Tax=Clitoria ternatea TaxID=43366 RepID=A0AAN9K7A7_CLITE